MAEPDNKNTPDFALDHPENFAQFILNGRLSISQQLKALINEKSIITAYLGNDSTLFQTHLLAIDEPLGKLYLAYPNDTSSGNLQALHLSSPTTLVSHQGQIKIEFRLPRLHEENFRDCTVLSGSVPDSLLRLQRREHFRLTPATTEPLHCRISFHGINKAPALLTLQLSDISSGGLGLLCSSEIAQELAQSMVLEDCRLELPGEGVIHASLRIRKTQPLQTHHSQQNFRIGCEYVNVSGVRLAMIERYIARLERERNAKRSGLAT